MAFSFFFNFLFRFFQNIFHIFVRFCRNASFFSLFFFFNSFSSRRRRSSSSSSSSSSGGGGGIRSIIKRKRER